MQPWTLIAAAVRDCEIGVGLISSPDHLVTAEVGLKSNFDQKFKTQHCSSTQPPLSPRPITYLSLEMSAPLTVLKNCWQL